jgi:hypothetical protein
MIDQLLWCRFLVTRLCALGIVSAVYLLVQTHHLFNNEAWLIHLFSFLMTHYFFHVYVYRKALKLRDYVVAVALCVAAWKAVYIFVPFLFCLHNAFSETSFYQIEKESLPQKCFYGLHLLFFTTIQINLFEFYLYPFEGLDTFLRLDRSVWAVINFFSAMAYVLAVLFMWRKKPSKLIYFLSMELLLIGLSSVILPSHVPHLWIVYYHAVFWLLWTFIKTASFRDLKSTLDLGLAKRFLLGYGVCCLVALGLFSPAFLNLINLKHPGELIYLVFRFDYIGGLHILLVFAGVLRQRAV